MNAEQPSPGQRSEPSANSLLHSIFDYIAKVANERNLDTLLILLADMGRDLITADRCTVWLIDKRNKCLWTRAAHGLQRVAIPLASGIAGHVAATGQAVIINDPYSDQRFDREVDGKTGYRTRSIIALPIQDSRGELMGVFQGINKLTAAGSFSCQDQERLLLASVYTGRELEAALLQEELENTQKEIIYTLAETGEMRSKETGSHVKRVAEYSRVLAKCYGLSQDDVELLKLASPLHDLGKIAIPDAILLKPAKLEPHEWKIMQTHAMLGYDMLKHSDRKIFKAAAIVAQEHHEKWNGEGYPNRLKGNDIHIFGRITAVADVFDALGSNRCYKKAWEMDRIVELFKAESGTHFEPDLVNALLSNLDDFIAIRNTYKDEYSDPPVGQPAN
jgi:HD-GYP domain-containing protein (c-di-GMP phosphodiesterase class II)